MPLSPADIPDKCSREHLDDLFAIIDNQLINNNSMVEIPDNLDEARLIEKVIEVYTKKGWNVKQEKCNRVVTQKGYRTKYYTRTLFFRNSTEDNSKQKVHLLMRGKEVQRAFFSKSEASKVRWSMNDSEYWVLHMELE